MAAAALACDCSYPRVPVWKWEDGSALDVRRAINAEPRQTLGVRVHAALDRGHAHRRRRPGPAHVGARAHARRSSYAYAATPIAPLPCNPTVARRGQRALPHLLLHAGGPAAAGPGRLRGDGRARRADRLDDALLRKVPRVAGRAHRAAPRGLAEPAARAALRAPSSGRRPSASATARRHRRRQPVDRASAHDRPVGRSLRGAVRAALAAAPSPAHALRRSAARRRALARRRGCRAGRGRDRSATPSATAW